MSTPIDPAPSAAEVKERLKDSIIALLHAERITRELGDCKQADHHKKSAETLTSAIALIERGELERERMQKVSMKTSIELIAEERARQITHEGWTAEHDKTHRDEELALAAACYALPREIRDETQSYNRDRSVTLLDLLWAQLGWDVKWWKPSGDRRRDLIKSGALIVAELDRTAPEKTTTSDMPPNDLLDVHAICEQRDALQRELDAIYSNHSVTGEVGRLRAQLAAATERVKRLEESLSDMVCMSETLIKNIAEFSKDPRILTTPSPRLDSARQLLAARAQPTPESK